MGDYYIVLYIIIDDYGDVLIWVVGVRSECYVNYVIWIFVVVKKKKRLNFWKWEIKLKVVGYSVLFFFSW